jgi:transcriptional regulator with XRE-family HTH domain
VCNFFLIFLEKTLNFAFLFYFSIVEKEFLQKVDLSELVKETGKTLPEIAKLSGIKQHRNLKKWTQNKENGGSRPTYNAIVNLLENGATVETLFGIDYKHNQKKENEPIKITDEDLSRALYRAAEILGSKEK